MKRVTNADPWEAIRSMTVDQIVTETKLRGAAASLNGFTTPEGWPFVLVVAVAKPGNERAVELAREFHAKVSALATFTEVRKRP